MYDFEMKGLAYAEKILEPVDGTFYSLSVCDFPDLSSRFYCGAD